MEELEEMPKREPEIPEKILDLTLEEIKMSVQSSRYLKEAGKNTVRDIVDMTEKELKSLKGVGKRSVEEIIWRLNRIGVGLKKDGKIMAVISEDDIEIDKETKLIILNSYPFNFAYDIIRNEDEALKVYVPGLLFAISTLDETAQKVIEAYYIRKESYEDMKTTIGLTSNEIAYAMSRIEIEFRNDNLKMLYMGIPSGSIMRDGELYQRYLQSVLSRNDFNTLGLGAIYTIKKALRVRLDQTGSFSLTMRYFWNTGKRYLQDIAEMSEKEVKSMKDMGKKRFGEISEYLERYGLTFKKD